MSAAGPDHRIPSSPRQRPAERSRIGPHLILIAMMIPLVLILASGAAGLLYQVLWMRLFALLFGNTAYAASAVLSGFLLGLAVGYHLVGSRRRRSERPLRLYALLELGTAVLALPIPWILSWAQSFYPALHWALDGAGSSTGAILAVKAVLALLILMPATACMGGTLPALGDAIVRHASGLGRRGGLVYGVNTAGAVLGALAAGFWLPASLGVQRTYLTAVVVNLMVGMAAWLLSFQQPSVAVQEGEAVHGRTRGGTARSQRERSASGPRLWPPALVIAGVSGFCLLGLEVLWTRMFAQVLQNSVYSYAAIVVTMLAGLALAALLVSWRSRVGNQTTIPGALARAMLYAGAATAATPFLFYLSTGGLRYQWMSESWGWYLVRLFVLVAAVVGPAVVIGGLVLPLVWRLWESQGDPPRLVVGRTAAVNTLCAVAGALAAGFLFLPAIGLWRSIFFYAGVWFAAAAWAGRGAEERRRAWPAPAAAVGLAAVGVLMVWAARPEALPLITLDPRKDERVVEMREGSHAIVAVVEQARDGDRRLKVDNFYTLGGVAAREDALLQGQLPLLLHPNPARVLYIGSATGIPPAGALAFPVEQIVAVELIPEVIELARRHFRDANAGVYDHPRVQTVAADGRNYLLSTRERFDVIIADLFIPWHAGAGSMYSREQFALASSRLKPGGLFCQWLPLYQLSPAEFHLIAATFLQAFPHTTLWRGDFYPDRPIVALIGHEGGAPIPIADLNRRLARLRDLSNGAPLNMFRDLSGLFMLYAGNLSQASGRFAAVPINTDDRPLLEYLAPRVGDAGLDASSRGKTWFIGEPLSAFYRRLHADVMEREDPLFPDQQLRHREYRMAGELFFASQVMTTMGQPHEAGKVLERIVELIPDALLAPSGRKGLP